MFVLSVLLAACTALAQEGRFPRDPDPAPGATGPLGILDRAGGTMDRSNIGMFFENRGKLYPRRDEGPDGEWPIGSGREYCYRMNVMVGVPGNVVQGRWRTNEEWEAAAGFHNRDSAKPAFSDKPYTWPSGGWPVKDATGNPVFVSDQDSYCVYNDSANTKQVLGLWIHQTAYAFTAPAVKDMIVWTFTVANRSQQTHDSLYFALYCDYDVANINGIEYQDDKIGWDRQKQLVYFYDADFGATSEWTGGPPGYFGCMMLRTPEVNGTQLGVTDMHYNNQGEDFDNDSVQYGIMSSARYLFDHPTFGPRYFHPGANAPDLHFDDPATIPAGGMSIVATLGSGPYTLAPGDSITFLTAVVAGQTLEAITRNAQNAIDLMNLGFVTARAPDPPDLTATPGDRRIVLTWNNISEQSRDRFSGELDFEGYRLYKSIDRGQHWDQIDRNQQPEVGPDPVPLAEYDRVNGLGPDRGLQYTYVDSLVTNGFEYWYSVTAYDRGDSLTPSLEAPRGNNAEASNLVIAFPRSAAAGRTPVGASEVRQTVGSSTFAFTALPTDRPEAGGRTHEIAFLPTPSLERGNPLTLVQVEVVGTTDSTADPYGVVFLSDSTFTVRNLATGSVVIPAGAYRSGTPVDFAGLRLTMRDTTTLADLRPQEGDSLVIAPGITVTANGSSVLTPRRFAEGTAYVTDNGVRVSGTSADPIREITQTQTLTVSATVDDPSLVRDEEYRVTVRGQVPDTSGAVTRINLEVLDRAGATVLRRDSVRSGTALRLTGHGFTIVPVFSAGNPPAPGTTATIRTQHPRPLTYQDRFTFTTTGAVVDNAAADAGLDRVKVVPNPYLVSSLYEPEFPATSRREPIRQLKFNNLPPRCTIRIFTLDGDEVQTIQHDSDSGTETWDMRTSGGREIAPGIYLYLVSTDTAERLARFAVIK
jgi:hypothetical protein